MNRQARSLSVLVIVLTYCAALGAVVHLTGRPPALPPASSSSMAPAAQALHRHPAARLSLPAHPRVLVVGDSYTEGWGAEPVTDGYAYLLGEILGWSVQVEGVGSTGYVNAGLHSKGTYEQRLARLRTKSFDLVVLQGGSNDEKSSTQELQQAVDSTVAAVHDKYPAAEVLMVGPVAPYGSARQDRIRVNATLLRYAREHSIPFVNPIYEKWFTPADQTRFVNLEKGHPNNAGYRRIAQRLAADVHKLSASEDGEAVPAAHPRVLVFGDSYTQGYGAESASGGYAYHVGPPLRWEVEVDGVGSTGYVDPGNRNQGNYLDRLARRPQGAFDIVVLQGSSNDADVPVAELQPAVDRTVAAFRARYPYAQLVMMGPVALYGRPSPGLVADNSVLSMYAQEHQIPFIDPIAQTWFPPGQASTYANPANGHPNDRGYARIANLFVRDARSIPQLQGR